jgi:hypothetical protein
VAVLAGPGADGAELGLVGLGGAFVRARRGGGAGAASAADLLCGANVLGERVVELVDVLLAEVDGVFRALVCEGDGVAFAVFEAGAIEVVDEEFDCLPCHGFSL